MSGPTFSDNSRSAMLCVQGSQSKGGRPRLSSETLELWLRWPELVCHGIVNATPPDPLSGQRCLGSLMFYSRRNHPKSLILTVPSCSVTCPRCLMPPTGWWSMGPCLPDFSYVSTKRFPCWETPHSVLGTLGLVLALPLRESSKSAAWFFTCHYQSCLRYRDLCQCPACWLEVAPCQKPLTKLQPGSSELSSPLDLNLGLKRLEQTLAWFLTTQHCLPRMPLVPLKHLPEKTQGW